MLLPWLQRAITDYGGNAGGVEVGGAAPSFAFSYATAAGGVEVGGAAVVPVYTFAIVIAGGVEVGGAAVVPVLSTTFSPAGGVEVGGTGAVITAIGVGIAGGVEVGSPQVPLTWTHATPVGGVEAGGQSVSVAITYSTPVGGVEVGGAEVVPTRTAGVDGPLGGVEVGGAEIVPTRTAGAAIAGGVEVGGVGPTVLASITTAPVGGVEAGGTGPTITFTQGGVSWTSGGYNRGPTSQREVLRALARRFVDGGLLLSDRVYICTDGEPNKSPPDNSYAEIFPGRKMPDQGYFAGGGIYSDLVTEVVEVRLSFGMSADQQHRANDWTMSPIKGAYQVVRDFCASALHGWDITDASNTIVVAEPIRVLSIDQPRDIKVDRGPGWKYISIQVEVKYSTDLYQ